MLPFEFRCTVSAVIAGVVDCLNVVYQAGCYAQYGLSVGVVRVVPCSLP
jgi:hypothetical protein